MSKPERRSYSAAFKVQVLDEAAQEGVLAAAVAEKHGILPNYISNWRAQEGEIRKLAASEAKRVEKARQKANGKSNGKHDSSTNGVTTGLPKIKLFGLTPLVQHLVAEEVKAQLPG